jgi:hypothetical protein
MAEVEVNDLFSHHNPLKFKKHPRGKQLYWANRSWREDRKGWGQLEPVKTTDSDWPEIQKCLQEAPLDLDFHGETVVKRGDLILCRKDIKAVERSNQRRTYLANRKVEALKKGHNPVTDELARLGKSQYVTSVKPEFRQEEPEPVPKAIRSGVAKK